MLNCEPDYVVEMGETLEIPDIELSKGSSCTVSYLPFPDSDILSEECSLVTCFGSPVGLVHVANATIHEDGREFHITDLHGQNHTLEILSTSLKYISLYHFDN